MEKSAGWLDYWVDPKTWRFRGDFEGMYRDFEDPWFCQRRNDFLERQVVLQILRDRHYQRILDVGCGLGGFTEILRKATDAEFVCGIDVSSTAIGKASAKYDGCQFKIADIRRDAIPLVAEGLYDLVMLQEVIWYILPELSDVFAKIGQSMTDEGILFIEQCFPSEQKFGKEFLQSADELISRYLMPGGFKVLMHYRQILEGEMVLLLKLEKG